MKKYTRVFFAGLALLAFNTSSFAADRAVKVNVGSDGSGAVSSNVATIRQVIGHAVGAGVVDKFIVDNSISLVEGGLIACAETGAIDSSSQEGSPPPGSADEFSQMVNQLRSIQADSGVFITIEPTEKCSIEAEGVACAQDAKQCPDGSYVGRQAPSCEFAPCPDQVGEE
jgi:hypothetical protein